MESSSKPLLVVLLGPTGVGKTDLCIRLADTFHVPIINADSRQIFAEIPIGTAAPTKEQLARVKHYFVGTHHLQDYYSASMFEQDALNIIQNEFLSHPCALMSGGSMMYIDAVCNGIDDIPTVDDKTRTWMKRRLAEEGLPALVQELKELDAKPENIALDIVYEDNDVMGLFKRLQRSNLNDSLESAMSSPFSDSKKLKEKTTNPKKKETPGRKGSRIFSFDSLHEVTRFAAIVSRKFDGINTLYKNEVNGKFYLILHQGNLEDNVFANICSLLTEYGKTEVGSTAEEQYLAEHYTTLVKDNAVQALSRI